MIVLPFPAKVLWPNGRTRNHNFKAAEFAKHKQWAYHAALAALPRSFKHDGEPIKLRVTITPKTAHKIDADNAVASLKAYFDGIAAALKVDDSCFSVPEITFATPRKPGGVEVSL
jgi:crossover junction endodeoxyribonuclease RusA